MSSVASRVLRRVRAKPVGSVFVPIDFLDLGGRDAVDQALSRLARSGSIRRVKRGVYDRPKQNPRIGTLSPRLPDVAAAIARSTGSRLQLAGAQAANQLGISTQVPARLTYLTDGTSRTVRVGKHLEIEFRRVSPRTLVGAGTAVGAVIQALRYVGRAGVTAEVVTRIRSALTDRDRRDVGSHLHAAPAWMHRSLRAIAAGSA